MIVSLVDRRVGCRLIVLRSREIAGEIFKTTTVKNLSPQALAGRFGRWRCASKKLCAEGLHAGRDPQRAGGRARELRIAADRKTLEQTQRHDEAVWAIRTPATDRSGHGDLLVLKQVSDTHDVESVSIIGARMEVGCEGNHTTFRYRQRCPDALVRLRRAPSCLVCRAAISPQRVHVGAFGRVAGEAEVSNVDKQAVAPIQQDKIIGCAGRMPGVVHQHGRMTID